MPNTDKASPDTSSFKEQWSDAWKDASKKLDENNKKSKEAFKKIKESFSDKNKDIDELVNSLKKEQESSSVKKFLFGSSYYDRYKDYEKYEAKKASIRNDSSLSESQKNYAVGFVEDLKAA